MVAKLADLILGRTRVEPEQITDDVFDLTVWLGKMKPYNQLLVKLKTKHVEFKGHRRWTLDTELVRKDTM